MTLVEGEGTSGMNWPKIGEAVLIAALTAIAGEIIAQFNKKTSNDNTDK